MKEKKKEKKKFQSALISPLGRWTGNTFLFKGGLSCSPGPQVAAGRGGGPLIWPSVLGVGGVLCLWY